MCYLITVISYVTSDKLCRIAMKKEGWIGMTLSRKRSRKQRRRFRGSPRSRKCIRINAKGVRKQREILSTKIPRRRLRW